MSVVVVIGLIKLFLYEGAIIFINNKVLAMDIDQ